MTAEVGDGVGSQVGTHRLRGVLGRLRPFVRPYRRGMVGAGALVTVWTLATLGGPWLVRLGIDDGITAGDRDLLTAAVVGYAVVSVVGYLAARAQFLVVARVGEGVLRDLRVRAFDHLQRQGLGFHDRNKAGVLVSRMTSDIDSLQDLVQNGLSMLVMNFLLLVLSVVVLLLADWRLALLCLIAVPPVLVASRKFQRDSHRAYLDVRDRIGTNLSRLQEGIAGVRVIQAHARQDDLIAAFGASNAGLYDAHMRSVWVQAWYLPVIELAGMGTTAVVVGVGGWMVTTGSVTLGTLTFFVLTLNNLFEPVQQLSQLFNTVQSAGAGLRKVTALLDTVPEVVERSGAVDLPPAGDIVVTGLGFAYGAGAPAVLRDVDLHLAVGERLALVGPTGAGKSTLAKLLARLYDPVEGSVCFAGVDLRDATLTSLRDRIVVVPQEGFLFQGSILDNVRLARPDASDAEVGAALAAVGALERFAALPEGLHTEVDERGARLSAGEKQLVSLARAALVDPALLVLDEATSSLDPGTEQLVEEAVARLMEGRTVVVIAHRLSTAARADRVGVVDGGQLVQLGSHDELVASDGPYRSLYASWMAGLGGGSVDQGLSGVPSSPSSSAAGPGLAK